MRLIDADKLVVDARLGDDETPYVSKIQIDEEPTVEAIPIEFIDKVRAYWQDMRTEYDGYYYEALIDLLKEWEKETCNKLATNIQQEMEKQK